MMRWEDERYVRFYTRDTPEFLALSWQARGLLGLIMRKLDRAGILAVGKLGLRGVAVAIGGPWVDVQAPLQELLDDGCLVYDEARASIMMPNFMDAQEASQSDASRKRASRERARAALSAAATPPIAGGDAGTRAAIENAGRGTVYIVQPEGEEKVKIGYTSAPMEQRLAGLQTGYPSRLVVLATLPGSTAIERALHERFAAYRLSGEWFALSADIRAFVAGNAAVGGGSQSVTDIGHVESRDVTDGHAASESVTLCCAVPSLAVPISHTLPPAPARDMGLGNLATPEVLLAIVGDYPRLSLLHGNREWSQNAGAITAEKLVRSEDARAAVQAFLLKKSTNVWTSVDDLSAAIGGFLANAKKHGDDARREEARAAERSVRPTRVRFSGPGAPNPTQTAFVPLAAHERPWSPEES